MGKIDKREMQWVRSLFRTSNTDERDVMGVYKGVMELVGINKELKKHIKCLKEVIRLKELKEPKEEVNECEWTYTETDGYETSCGNYIDSLTWSAKYCQFCGKLRKADKPKEAK